MARFEPGTTVGGYRIEATAGRGGMGVVYRATQLGLDRQVALKVITPDLAEDVEFRRRFTRESRIAASIEHPHVIPVHEAGEADGVLFISMRFIAGTDLRSLLDEGGRLGIERSLRVLEQIGSALDAAHARGLVHRDIKPGNVLLTTEDGRDHAYLTDFGLSKHHASQSGFTKTGAFVGTLDYMAPEQITGAPLDARSDVYALGAVLYEMLTGRVPYQRDSDVAKLWAHMNEPPPAPSDLAGNLAPGLDAVVARAMAKEPEERFPSASDLARAARAAVEGGTPGQERRVATGDAAPVTGEAEVPLTHTGRDSQTRIRVPRATAAAPSEEGSGDGRSRLWPALAGAAAALAVGGVILLASGALSDDDDAAPGGDLQAGETVSITSFAVDSPSSIALGGGAAWVPSYDEDTVTRIDAATGEADEPITVGDGPGAIALEGDFLWVAQSDAGNIGRVDIGRGELVGTPVEGAAREPDSIEAGEGGVWAVDEDGTAVVQIDPGTGEQVRRIEMPDGVQGDLAVGEGGVWVVNSHEPTITRIDPASGRIAGDPIVVGEPVEDESFPAEVAVGEGALWVSNGQNNTVVRVNPRSGEVEETLSFDDAGIGGEIAVGLGSVWVATGSGHIERIDPSTNAVDPKRIPGGAVGIRDLEADEGGLWVAGDQERDTVLRISLP